MELARLASKQQAASSSKQAAPQGPFLDPEQQGSRNRKKCYHAVRDGFSQLFYTLRFHRLDPHGREITKYGGFSAILAQDGLWHLKKSRARAETGKTQFPGARGPETEKKLPRYPGWLSATFLHLRFDRPDPQGREIAKYGGFRPFWPRTALGT